MIELCMAIDLPRKRIVIFNNEPHTFEEVKTLYSRIVEWHRHVFPLCVYMPIRVVGTNLRPANDFTLEFCRVRY